MLLRITILVIIFSVTSTAFAQKGLVKLSDKDRKPFTPEDLLNFKRLGSFKVSPDGKKILYTFKEPNLKSNSFNSNIYTVDIDGSNVKQVTNTTDKESNALWSADGDKIYYLSNELGSTQVFEMELETGRTRAVTSISGGVSNLKLSPDGSHISFTTEVDLEETLIEKYNDLTSANAMKFDDLPIRHWDTWEDDKYSHLFIKSLKNGDEIDIMEGEKYETPLKPFGGNSQIAWSPDGKEIAYTCKKVDDYVTSTNSDIYIYNLETKKTINITEGMPGYDKNPLYSPDGKWIAFHSQKRAGFEADRIRLMLYNRSNGEIKELPKELDQWADNMTWAPNSENIYFSSGNQGRYPLYKVDTASGKWERLTNDITNDNSGIDITPNGKTLVFGRTSMTAPSDIYTLDLENSTVRRVTSLNDLTLMKLKDVKIEERWIESTDGERVHTWVLHPPDFDPSKKYPMLTYCQGGPQGTISNYFSYRWNLYLMASQGYVVCAPNRRGMPGFGQEWNDEISKNWGEEAMEDILAATDKVSEESYVDENRIAAVGASFGGYTVFWLQAHDEGKFKAFISHCGVFNLESMYGSTEELFFPNWEFGGPYWDDDNEDIYEDYSPHRFVEKWDSPILIITGMKDFRVPYTQSLEAYTAAKTLGLDAELLIFPEENHWVLSLQNALLWQKEFFDFLDKHLR